MCRKNYVQYRPIKASDRVKIVLQEIEIEMRRLIAEYQRETLNNPFQDNATNQSAQSGQVQDDIIPSLDEIMPLPKKKLKISDVLNSDNQVSVEEAIADASKNENKSNTKEPQKTKTKEPEETAALKKITIAEAINNYLERRAQIAEMKAYFKSLDLQVKNKCAPLEQMIEFLHENYENER